MLFWWQFICRCCTQVNWVDHRYLIPSVRVDRSRHLYLQLYAVRFCYHLQCADWLVRSDLLCHLGCYRAYQYTQVLMMTLPLSAAVCTDCYGIFYPDTGREPGKVKNPVCLFCIGKWKIQATVWMVGEMSIFENSVCGWVLGFFEMSLIGFWQANMRICIARIDHCSQQLTCHRYEP